MLISPGLQWPNFLMATKCLTILFKITTRMKLSFSNYSGEYSYSFQGSVELICITVTVSLFFMQNAVTKKNSPQLERGRGVTDRGVTAPKSSERFSEIFRGFQRFSE